MKQITLKKAKEMPGSWEIVKTGFFNEAYINVIEPITGRWVATTKVYDYQKLKKEFDKRGIKCPKR